MLDMKHVGQNVWAKEMPLAGPSINIMFRVLGDSYLK